MKRAFVVAGAAILAAAPIQAQSVSDAVAHFALMTSPIGSLPNVELPSGGTVDRRANLGLRVGSWKIDGIDSRFNTYGATFSFPTGAKARIGATLAYGKAAEANSDAWLMLGVDAGAPVWASATTEPNAVSIDFRGNVGFSSFQNDDGGTSMTLVGQVPLKFRHTFTGKSIFSAHVTPGFGWASFKDDFTDESGTRPMIGFGGAWTTSTGVGLHLGTQQVILDAPGSSPPWVLSFAVTVPIGQAK